MRPAAAQDLPAVRPDIAQLLQVSGAGNVVQQIAPLLARQVTGVMRASNPSISDRVVDVVTQVVTSYLTDPNRTHVLMDQIGDVYARTFSPAEIQQLIAFYDTPVGRKLAASLPQITNESAQIGQAWARQMIPGLRQAIGERLRAEGLAPQ